MKNTYKQGSSSHHHLFLTQKVQQQRHHGAYSLPHDKSTLSPVVLTKTAHTFLSAKPSLYNQEFGPIVG
ncbi:hypothetical protein PRUPE_3G105300 [Prunus persica]|uniref:Uncharacterized protein n=1 Tax=Prunus persica TaxID=3760 RepID=A0A251PYI2_PRUPE|nr:hypothetical protein PRUPE_3G105300 [Prunus persica]